MPVVVHRSNRVERLVEALAALVGQPPADPFAAEPIVVPGRGMGRWLSLELARRFDIWANPAFPFPRAFIDQLAAALLGALEVPQPYAPETLTWALAAELQPARLSTARFAAVRGFLRDDVAGSRLAPLAMRLAELFDRYAVFRPEMVLGWERGEGDHWQADLWRAVVARLGPGHPAARGHDLIHALRAGSPPAGALPARVSLFGLATLPPLYLEILAALAAHCELHLFLLSPTPEYWADLAAAREQQRARVADREAALHTAGPPLLGSLGRIGRDFQALIEDHLEGYEDAAVFADPGEGSLLAALQSDCLTLRERGPADAPPLVLRPEDTSITVHACHSPMREVEVLHDRLVQLFAADRTLRPDEVIVMLPSIEAYAPLVEAVFTSPDRPRIPFHLADRRARATQDVIEAFLRALDLLGGRLPASDVFDLLGLPPVRARYEIPAERLEALRGWCTEAGVRWGADAAHRAAENFVHNAEHTWQFGLDRLLLGTAMPEDADTLWGGALPCGDLEGDDAVLLGQCAAFVAMLARFRDAFAAPRPLEAWRAALGELLDALVAHTPATADQHDAVLGAIAGLAARAARAGFEAPLGRDIMRRLLDDALGREAAPQRFLTGAVTICALVPMRAIPFRVVCLVGLNDGEFPRTQRPLGFDLMAHAPRRGDRTARDDDRYLFLEALLSARERLLITYVGRSIVDNASLPPAVVVAELLDAIDATARPPAAPEADAHASVRVVYQHPLQPFSPEAFGAEPMQRSAARSQYAGARALCAPARTAPPPFLTTVLPEQPLEVLELDDLLDFFANPAKWFLRRQMRLTLPRDSEFVGDREPIELDHLEEWQVGSRMIQHALRGLPEASARPVLRAAGLLPHGTPGEVLVDGVQQTTVRIAAQARAALGEGLRPREITLSLGGVQLNGLLRELGSRGVVRAQYSKLGRRYALDVWIRHLVYCAACDPNGESLLVGRDQKGRPATLRFAPVRDAAAHLDTLVALFRAGQCRPLPFLPITSRRYAEGLYGEKGSTDAALRAAREAFSGRNGSGEGDDPHVAQLFPSFETFAAAAPQADLSFSALAETVCRPYVAHVSESAALIEDDA